MSITVSDDQDSVAAGDELGYTITVVNLGTSDAFDLTVTQTVPDGLAFATADNGGTLTTSTVAWSISVKAAETATLSSTMTVGETPEELLRLASVACALTAPDGPPVVCATDSNILPAGVAAEKAADPSGKEDNGGAEWIVGASLGAALVVGVSVFLVNRRRKSSRQTP